MSGMVCFTGYGVAMTHVQRRFGSITKRRGSGLQAGFGKDNKRHNSLPGLGESSVSVVKRARSLYDLSPTKLASHVAALTRDKVFPTEADVAEYCKGNGLDTVEIAAAVFPELQGRPAALGEARFPPTRRSSLPAPVRPTQERRRSSIRRSVTFDNLSLAEVDEEQLSGWSSLDYEEDMIPPLPTSNIGMAYPVLRGEYTGGGLQPGTSLPPLERRGTPDRARRNSALMTLQLKTVQKQRDRTRASYFNVTAGGAGGRSRNMSVGAEMLVGRSKRS